MIYSMIKSVVFKKILYKSLFLFLVTIPFAVPSLYPERVITLAPSLGELVADLLSLDLNRLVGVSAQTDYPPRLKEKPVVGQYHKLNIEKVLSLKPDCVFATFNGNERAQIERLKELKIPVYILNEKKLSDVGANLLEIGKILGQSDRAKSLETQINSGIDRLRSKYQSPRTLKKVFIQLGSHPLITAGSTTYLHEALELVGAKNLYEEIHQDYPKVSVEDVLQKNPDVILVFSFDQKNDDLQYWQKFQFLSAVKNKKVILFNEDTLLRLGPRILEGLSKLAQAIHGET